MNSRRWPIRNIARTTCAAALLCAAAGVSAQTVYRQADPAGSITYSDQPGPALAPPAATGSAADVAIALASKTAISSRRGALIDAKEAARRLGQAERERKQGAERLPFDRARATDASAESPRYLRRQAKLRRMHEQAQRRASELGRKFRARP